MIDILEKIKFILEQNAVTSYGRQAQQQKTATSSAYKSSVTAQRSAAASRVRTQKARQATPKKSTQGPSSNKEWWNKIKSQRQRHSDVINKRKSANTSGYQSRLARTK
jgi:hypothetical protein